MIACAQCAFIAATAQIAPGAFLFIALAIGAAPFAALYALEVIVDRAQGKTAAVAIAMLVYATVCLTVIASTL